jgi:hypothetical protein
MFDGVRLKDSRIPLVHKRHSISRASIVNKFRERKPMTLRVPSLITDCIEEVLSFKAFLQGMVERKFIGGLRYGRIKSKQRYLTLMKKELRAYEQDGNMEQLINIAVYCFLESYAPQHPRFHYDPTVESVTREEL